jgi:hypothetical protein
MSAAVNGSGSKGGTTSPADLAAMLRRSAEIVERRDFHPLLYQTMKALTAYAGEYAHGGVSTAAAQSGSSSSNKQRQRDELNSSTKQGKKKNNGAFHDVPDSVLDSPSPPKTKTQQQSSVSHSRVGGAAGAAEKMGASGGQFSSAAASASGKSNQDRQQQHSNNKGGFTKGLIGIKKGFEKLGADIMGDHHHNKEDNDDAPFDEYAWCDEHFTRGCGCKQRKNVGKTTKEASSSSDQPESTSNAYDSNKKSKPCFQRPINPNSNLIANGWIDQQRRSKMRVVWKDVLASLVEGRRPGEETTLWIQRQVVDPQTGKVTGLEALHQIPMKWLEEVNYVDIYGDHRFTLKVYNFAEEFYFRTRDEQSAQSWVITLRSARDSSLENIGRMSDNNANNSNNETPPMEMGLDYLDGSGKSSTNQTPPTDPPPTAQAGNDDSEQQRIPSSNQTPQQQTQTTSGRLKISELRAIAHGAGYDTRGMERKDLEKIAAIVSGSVPPSPGTTEESDSLRRSKQKEAMMRDSERREREEREQREREKEERERAEALRREQQAERDRAERERIAAEQRRQQEDAQRQKQIEEIKRRQEEERLKRMAEIQAEAKRKQEEENMRREQQQRSHIPTPPSSGGAPFNQQQQQWGQQQQQYHQWQQQQQQQHQHHHAQYQQQAYANHHQPQQSQNPQFFNQQGGGAYQQSQYQQQQQQQQHHQQQQYQPDPSASKYVKQMEEKSDEEQSAAETQIKRNILINWALQPPNLNALRPIDQLVTSIHTAMPPAFGVPGHNYFTKFTPISHAELVVSAAMGNHPDENKLKKAVRKVRVFLHPDKLPRDLSSEQSFMARMLWDITSDSWEEFQKHKDELDWIRS